jgi:hypothetical protein
MFWGPQPQSGICISTSDWNKYGCPACQVGIASTEVKTAFYSMIQSGNSQVIRCAECGIATIVVNDGDTHATIGTGDNKRPQVVSHPSREGVVIIGGREQK